MGQSTMDWTGANDAFSGSFDPNQQFGTSSPGSYNNGGNDVLGSIFGQANAPDQVYFGGTPSAAGGMSHYYQQHAAATGTNAAPTIGEEGTRAIQGQMEGAATGQENARFYNQQAQNAQNESLEKLSQAANGYGPSAAQAQLQAGTDQAMQANMAMANSARGQAGLANAQKNALSQNGVQGQQAANQAAQLRAQEMQQAQSQYASTANQMQNQLGAQQQGYANLGMQGANALQGNAYNQAQLQAGQNALNQQGQLGYQQLGFNAQAEALQAAQGNQNNAYQLNESNAKNASSGIAGLVGAAGAAMMLSDARAKNNIRDAGPKLDEALSALGAHQYEYNVPGQPRGTQTGVMAQELASTDAGRKLVAPYPGGGMGVKVPEATNFALAGIARLNERLNNLQRGETKFGDAQYGDMQFQEPGGGSAAWTIREEPDFLLAKNDRTGELRKLLTGPLDKNEKQQAVNRPHGAGPINGRRVPSNGTFGDGMLGGIMGGGDSTPSGPTTNPQAAVSPAMMNGAAGPQVVGQQPPMQAPQQQFGAGANASAFGPIGSQWINASNMAKQQGAASALNAASSGIDMSGIASEAI